MKTDTSLTNRFALWGFCGITFALTSLPPAAAQPKVTCDPLKGAIPQLEEQKSAFASGDFASFFAFTDRVASKPVQQGTTADSFEATLRRIFPNGFASCSTLSSQKASERLVTETIMFVGENGEILFLVWDAAIVAGKWEVLYFHVADSFAKVRSGG